MFLLKSDEGDLSLVTSASDLTAASTCEFAFLRRVDARFGRDVIVPLNSDEMLERAARLGDAHELRVLNEYRARYGAAVIGEPGGVAELPERGAMTAAALGALAQLTQQALKSGAEVVFQATFFDPAQNSNGPVNGDPVIAFLGFADFLELKPDASYEVQDTKLARSAKVTALLQLAAYAEQLERIGVPVAPEAALLLGNGTRSTHLVSDIAPVFRSRRERMHHLLWQRARVVGEDGSRSSGAPIAWGSAGIVACGRCEVCAPEVLAHRDPLLIAGLNGTQRQRLMAAGLTTIDAVSEVLPQVEAGSRTVPGISQAALERISAQAAVQNEAVTGTAPPYRVIRAEALRAIPYPSPGDLFFDFEGDPMFREAGPAGSARWGLDYLFGMVDPEEKFTAFWAHDLDAERRALEAFLEFVTVRRRKYPDLRIYHYAAYERTHLTSIAARHGVGEAAVDQLLREHVLVDLYPIVRSALRVGSPSYSIKALEPLYMPPGHRNDSSVSNGGQSVSEYAEASAQLRAKDPLLVAAGQARLDDIAEYNRVDCVSTLRLRDWLLALAAEHHQTPLPSTEVAPDTVSVELSSTAIALQLHAHIADDPLDRKTAALAASAIDYHRREQKSFWWSHFARLVDPIEEWADTRDVLVVEQWKSSVTEEWHKPPRARSPRREIRIRGVLAPGSSLKEGAQLNALYAFPAPSPTVGAAPGARGAKLVTVTEVHDDGVTVTETLGSANETYDVLPVALVPGPPPQPGTQPGAIEEWGAALVEALDAGYQYENPVVDIMRRDRPCLIGGAALTATDSEAALIAGGGREDGRTIGAVVASLRQLNRSAIAVQGPPGTGKTYLAARVIRTLVERDGWHIGVVAQSHKVVENVLTGVVAAGLSAAHVGKMAQRGSDPSTEYAYTVLPYDGQKQFQRNHRESGRGSVIGGTAWDFSNEKRFERGSLDLLVIDEAGQFSLAPTIAASVAAKRLLLLGDPQQLPQVSQGQHPEPIDESALGWLLGDRATVPADRGYFLAETRRMRPELAEIVSELSYAGRLQAHSTASLREAHGVGEPGLHWYPVQHEGNATFSREEAEAVVQITRNMLRGSVSEAGEPTRNLTEEDVIVVAAYNAQVECIHSHLVAAGLPGVRVGTVDKFQGQEAVIAVVSLSASSAEDVPRGLEFLLMRNRLNVAISRAQWSAHLVSSERLGSGLPATPEGVAALSGYLRLTERGTVHSIPTENFESARFVQ